MNDGLQFQLAGIPVKVLWMFFVVAALFGYSSFGSDTTLIAIWMVVMFAGILAHEMGHAFAYRRFGVQPSVVLHGFGGLTFGRSLPVGKDLLVSLAGPFTGLAIGLPIWWVYRNVRITDPLLLDVLWMAIFVNVAWSILNLLPLMPLDGGNATNAILSMIFGRDMTRITRYLSLLTAAVLFGLALKYHFTYGALLLAYFAFMNFQALREGPVGGRFQPTVSGPKPAKVKRQPGAKRAKRTKGSKSAPTPTAPQPSWSPTPPDRPPSSPISTVGWAQPPKARSFSTEITTATQALERNQPELAAIAIGRARRLATSVDEVNQTDRLQAEVDRRMAG